MDPAILVAIALGGALLVAAAAVIAIRQSTKQRDPDATVVAARDQAEAALRQAQADIGERDRRIATLEADSTNATARMKERDEALERLRAERDAELERFRNDLQAERIALGALKVDHATLKEAHEKDRARAEERLNELNDTREQMTRQFRELADQVLLGHSTSFKQQNREQIEALLNPLNQRIVEFRTGMTEAQQQAAEGRAALKQQIESLQKHSSEMTQETLNLTRALKGKAQTQGAWGEMILATILEKSGLREGEEFSTQQSETLDSGKRLRPDVVVNLPNDHKIIIDSKVSLVAFEAHVNAETEAEQAASLKRHVESLRQHIRDLSSKDYSRITGATTDYVIMFVPIEGAFSAALQESPDLTGFAISRNITMATPTTLITLLRTVGSLWQVECQQKNAEDIANRAGLLYDKFVGFVEDVNDIGRHLDRAAKAQQAAVGKLVDGRGNLVNQATELKTLGAKAKKELPPAMVEASGATAIAAPDATGSADENGG